MIIEKIVVCSHKIPKSVISSSDNNYIKKPYKRNTYHKSFYHSSFGCFYFSSCIIDYGNRSISPNNYEQGINSRAQRKIFCLPAQFHCFLLNCLKCTGTPCLIKGSSNTLNSAGKEKPEHCNYRTDKWYEKSNTHNIFYFSDACIGYVPEKNSPDYTSDGLTKRSLHSFTNICQPPD